MGGGENEGSVPSATKTFLERKVLDSKELNNRGILLADAEFSKKLE